MIEQETRTVRDASRDSVRVGDGYYMGFLAYCREEGEDGANFQLAMALSKLKDAEAEVRALREALERMILADDWC